MKVTIDAVRAIAKGKARLALLVLLAPLCSMVGWGCDWYGNLWASASYKPAGGAGGNDVCGMMGMGGAGGMGGGFGGDTSVGGAGTGIGGSGVGVGGSAAIGSASVGVGVGGSPGEKPAPPGGGTGDTFVACTDACNPECAAGPAVGTFSPSIFKFMVVIADDGEGASGGWQQASAVLNFRRWTGVLPESWSCPQITVGMPLRAALYGPIGPNDAALMSANVANGATSALMHPPGGVDYPPGVFCSKLKDTMNTWFTALYPQLGQRVTSP